MGIYAYSQSIHKYLPLPRRSHVADGLLQRQVQIDDFDADCFDDIVVTTRALDPRNLPPIKVVQVGAELRIPEHAQALAQVDAVRRFAERADPRAVWMAFGTARRPIEAEPRKSALGSDPQKWSVE